MIQNSNGAIGTDKMKKELRQEHQGAKNTGEPMIIQGEKVDYKQTQLDPATSKVPEKILTLSRRVMSAFGLPKYLMDLDDGGEKYNNHALQSEHYIKYTVLPIAKKVQEFFNKAIIEPYKVNGEFKYNIATEIYTDEVLQNLEDSGTITPNEHRKLLNFPESDNELMDIHYVKNDKVAIEDLGKSFDQPMDNPDDKPEEPPKKPDDEAEEPPEEKKIERGLARIKTWRDKYYISEPQSDIWTYKELAENINIQRVRNDFELVNQKTRDRKSKEYSPKMLSYLTKQYMAIFKAMAKNESELQALTGAKAEKDVDSYVNKLIKVKDEQVKITEIAMPLYQSVGDATFANTANILTVSVPFAMSDPGVAEKVGLLHAKTVLVPETTRNEIEAVVRRGIENQSTPAEVAKDMWRHFVDENNELPDRFTVSTVSGKRLEDRAVTIARNEVSRANRSFNAESIKQSGVVKSIQLVGLPDADGTCTPYFNQNWPFEMADELSSIHVNCRCTIVPGEIVLL